MNESSQAAPAVRRYRSRSEALRLAAEFEQSGLSRQAFSKLHGISTASLDNYCKLDRSHEPLPSTTPADLMLVPVDVIDEPISVSTETPHSDAGLFLMLPHGRRIAIGFGFDVATLTRLLSVLEQA